ncbi:MAG: hypothetical protein LBJ01_00455 [Tannerella sp.]|jgi:hypothetical protein|nr:hypothetical protein [Tannerella sp.]
MKKINRFLIQLYTRFRGRPGALNRAVNRARRLHRKTGRRYRVFFFGYRYRVWNRNDIRGRIKAGLFLSGLKAGKDFDRVCFFDTNDIEPQNSIEESCF